MASQLSPPPIDTQSTDDNDRHTSPWARWFQQLWSKFSELQNAAYFMARNNGSPQSVLNNANTQVLFATEELDNRDAFDSSTFTCPAGGAGIYEFSAAILFDPGAGISEHRMYITKNDVTVVAGGIRDAVTSFTQLCATGRVGLVAGDTMKVFAYQTNGTSSARNIQGDGNFTYFTGWKLP